MIRLFLKFQVFIYLLILALPAIARVGGGQSYSGGGSSYSSSSSSSGGGGGGGGGGLIGLLLELVIRLVIYYPKIGIPLVLGGVVFYYWHKGPSTTDRRFEELQKWSSEQTVARREPPSLKKLRTNDPNFSEVLFLDFVGSIYTKLLTRVGRDLSEIGAYLESSFRERLETNAGRPANAVLIGSIRVLAVRLMKDVEKVSVEIESNLALDDGSELYVVDQLSFKWAAGTGTNPPETVYTLSCPGCGNTSKVEKDGKCGFCGQIVNDGRSSWVAYDLQRHHSTPKPPAVLSDSGVEIGTDLPTERAPDLKAQLEALKSADPDFDLGRFEQFAGETFLALQKAWTEMNWEKARPLETDFLFQQHQYWMDTYRKTGVRNVLEAIQVGKIEISKVTRDRFFEGITVRIFAKMKDYTVWEASGKVASGNPAVLRTFSEYWTFVRRTGVTTKERDAARCPSCGAPLDKVDQVGVCEYCQSKITRGDFDWILSRIEQDEAYFI